MFFKLRGKPGAKVPAEEELKSSIKFEHDAPINPELNPPESLEELEALIRTMQLKSIDIKHQLDMAERKMNRGTSVDVERLTRAEYARQRTNYSISVLQQIAKKRKAALIVKPADKPEDYAIALLEKQFMREARKKLSAEDYNALVTASHSAVLKQLESD